MCCLQVITNNNNTHILNRKYWKSLNIYFLHWIFFLHREFAPTAGSGISEPKPTDRAKVKKYKFSSFSNLFFRCFKTLGAGCKPLPLKTRKCLHFPKLLCLGIFWQKSDLIGVLVDIDWEIGSRSIVPIFRSHYSRRLLTILICLLLYSIPGQSGDEDVMVQMVK